VKAYPLRALERRWGARLDGLHLVDLGCGGGLLSLPLAERGACVTGIDLSGASLQAADAEAKRRGLAFRSATADLAQTPLADGCADLVVLSDVLEHVTPPRGAIDEAARLLKPGGRMYVNTINRTWRARVLAIWLAEGLRFVPPGTHDARLFVRPSELRQMAEDAGLRVESLAGEAPRLLATLRSRAIELRPSRSLAVGYGAFLSKEVGA
jgi:2-polyprenyl-6-hydroxyphenyl methylase/3-demethylubiquinone-9 3-methyltransferase